MQKGFCGFCGICVKYILFSRWLFFSRKDRKERKVLFPLVFHACAGVVANFVTTRVRREFIHPLPPAGYYPCLRGRMWVIALAVVTNCPPETGWTSEAEGVDDTNERWKLSTPSPLRGTRPCLRGRKWVIALHSCNYSPPLWRGRGEGPLGLLLGRGPSLKNLYIPLCPVLGGGNPRIVKARSSHGICLEHEWPGAWQYVSTTKTKRRWRRKF